MYTRHFLSTSKLGFVFRTLSNNILRAILNKNKLGRNFNLFSKIKVKMSYWYSRKPSYMFRSSSNNIYMPMLNKNKEISDFWPKSLEKVNFSTKSKCHFYTLGNLLFLTSSNNIPRPVLNKNKVERNFKISTKIMC